MLDGTNVIPSGANYTWINLPGVIRYPDDKTIAEIQPERHSMKITADGWYTFVLLGGVRHNEPGNQNREVHISIGMNRRLYSNGSWGILVHQSHTYNSNNTIRYWNFSIPFQSRCWAGDEFIPAIYIDGASPQYLNIEFFVLSAMKHVST